MDPATNVTQLVAQSDPNIVTTIGIAIGIFLIGLVLGRILGRLTHKFLEFLGIKETMFKREKKSFSLRRLVSEAVSFSVYVMFTIIALNYIGVTSFILTGLAGTAIIILAISAVLSLRDSVPNIIAYTTIIAKHDAIAPGDTITINSVTGKVTKITMLEVEVETSQKDILHIPNRLFTQEKFTCKKAKKKVGARKVKSKK